jgi:hypothetical protein
LDSYDIAASFAHSNLIAHHLRQDIRSQEQLLKILPASQRAMGEINLLELSIWDQVAANQGRKIKQ